MKGRWLKKRCSDRRRVDPVAVVLVVHLARLASFPDRNAAADMAAVKPT